MALVTRNIYIYTFFPMWPYVRLLYPMDIYYHRQSLTLALTLNVCKLSNIKVSLRSLYSGAE